MAFTLRFPTHGPVPGIEDISEWLHDQGEAFEPAGLDTLSLLALPVRVHFDAEGAVRAHMEISETVPLTRLVGLLFELSVRLRADVHLVGSGRDTRQGLWIHLADEQDRRRLQNALNVAIEQGDGERVQQDLWAIVHALGHGDALAWDPRRHTIVRMTEVGAPEGIALEDAKWHKEDAVVGDLVGVPAQGPVHILAWRWLSEAWPRLVSE